MMNKYSIFPRLGILLTALLLMSCDPLTPIATIATPAEIKETLKASQGKLTLVHVWATWCDPCRDEFPELVQIMNEFSEVDYLLVSADDPEEPELVEAFLQEYNSPADSLISTALNTEFIEALSPDWDGALPATFFYQDGKIVREWEGKRTHGVYAETIETLLKTKGAQHE